MSFRPRMNAFTTGISPIGEVRFLALDGIVADLWSVEGTDGASGYYVSPDPRLTVMLDPARLAFSQRLPDAPAAAGSVVEAAFIPAGCPVWGSLGADTRFRHLDLHFNTRRLCRLLDLPPAKVSQPILRDHAPRVQVLAALIAEQCIAEDRPPAYSEALVQALLLEMFREPAVTARTTGGLTPAQMKRVTAFMHSNIDRRVGVEDLAREVGLSASWFARAFKATTGTPPHRWQIELRVSRAEHLLGEGLPPAEVAAATGFSDQAHLTRSFSAITGTTPAAWQKKRQPGGTL